MTVQGFKKNTSNLDNIEFIGTTSLQKVYIRDRIKKDTFKINDSDETFEYDTIDGLHFIFDITDVNCIMTNPDHIKYSPSLLP